MTKQDDPWEILKRLNPPQAIMDEIELASRMGWVTDIRPDYGIGVANVTIDMFDEPTAEQARQQGRDLREARAANTRHLRFPFDPPPK